jgi:hypothetical protein
MTNDERMPKDEARMTKAGPARPLVISHSRFDILSSFGLGHSPLLRRFLVLAGLMFWVGGFTFYGAVVVPVGLHEIGVAQQSRVTGPATFALNVAGAVALVPFLWDVLRCGDPSVRRQGVRWVTWAGMALTLAGLFWLHRLLTLHVLAGLPSSDPSFHMMHRAYLWVGTVQWACALVFTGASLSGWRAEDRALGTVGGAAKSQPVTRQGD